MPTADEYFNLAERLNDEYSAFEEAAILYGWAVELAESTPMLTRFALALMKCGEGERALDAAKKAVAIDPDDPKALNALGLALADQLDGEGAMKAYERSIRFDPTNYAPYFNRGGAAFTYGKYAQAAEDFLRAILLKGEISEHDLKYSALQLELQSAEGITRLIGRFRKEAGPSHADAFRLLDLIGKYLQDPGGFPRDAGRRLRVGKDLLWTVPVLRYIAERDWKDYNRNLRIARFLNKAIQMSPEDPSLRWARADLFHIREEKNKGHHEDLAMLAKTYPRSIEIRSRWLSYLCRQREDDAAMKVIEFWLAEDSEAWEPLNEKVDILDRRKEYEAELEILDRLCDIYALDEIPEPEEDEDEDEDDEAYDWEYADPVETTSDLHGRRATCLGKLGRWEEAEKEFETAVEFGEAKREEEEGDEPGFGNGALIDRARWYVGRGLWKEALADFNLMMAQTKPMEKFFEERAAVREKLGDAQGAAEDRKKMEEMKREVERKTKEYEDKQKAEKEAKRKEMGGGAAPTT